jgi:hydrogenase maturation factor
MAGDRRSDPLNQIKNNMCLTIPKKVIAVFEDGSIELELHDGSRQKVKTMVDLEIADYCLTQQNIAIEKITAKEAKEILKILDGEVEV